MYNPIEESVKEFIEKFDAKDSSLYYKLVNEEVDEAFESLAHLLKELSDVAYVVTGYRLNGGNLELGTAKADIVSYVAQLLINDPVTGALFQEAFVETHRSNMSKLGDDGKPVRREDGKVLKGPNYSPPDIGQVILDNYAKVMSAPEKE